MTHRALATGDSKPDIEVLHNLWGQRWRPFRWSSAFDHWSGKRGKYTIRGTLRGYSEFEVRVELNPGDDIERSMRLQTECLWPGCANLADHEPLALKVTQDYRYSNRYEVFSFCREHGCDAGAVCALMGKEPWGFYEEAIRRGILSASAEPGGTWCPTEPVTAGNTPSIQRGDIVKIDKVAIGVAVESVGAREMVTVVSSLEQARELGIEGTFKRCERETKAATALTHLKPATWNGVEFPPDVSLSTASRAELERRERELIIDQVGAEVARDWASFLDGELARLYPSEEPMRIVNASNGYPAPVHLTPADDGVLVLPWGAVRRAHAGVPIELPVGFGLSEFRAYSRRALDLVDEMLRGGGLQESLGLYEECERRARRERAEAGAQAEALHAAACDARGSLDAKFKRERERLPPAPATPPGATRHWASFESGCNWED